MKVSLLIIAHNRIGAELLATATHTLGSCPLDARVLEVTPQSDPETLLAAAEKTLRTLDAGAGVLVLTDAFGSTPSNVANQLDTAVDVRVVAGVNLPMVIRVLNYPQLGLDALAEKAVSGGRDGVLLCDTTPGPR